MRLVLYGWCRQGLRASGTLDVGIMSGIDEHAVAGLCLLATGMRASMIRVTTATCGLVRLIQTMRMALSTRTSILATLILATTTIGLTVLGFADS